jgi:hypothetical protein
LDPLPSNNKKIFHFKKNILKKNIFELSKRKGKNGSANTFVKSQKKNDFFYDLTKAPV